MEPYITPAIPKLMKMYMYSFAASGAIGSCQRIILYNPILSIIPESNIVPTAGAFGTHLLKYGKE
jgi:hypothetical protein